MSREPPPSATSTARTRWPLARFIARAAPLVALFTTVAVEARPLWRLNDLFAPPSRALAESHVPHSAVARIIVPEHDGTAYGSGTLVDARDQYGLVVTNHHVVRSASGPIEVVFPNGFRSFARALKTDSEWDLAALAIWRPENIMPVQLAAHAPRPGDVLTICGYGQGQYRSITGRCTDYYAPSVGMPRELVELDVEARQGDSGGPIFNAQHELAGVLFGAGQGTTLGSFGGRVKGFLVTLAPDIGSEPDETVVAQAEISESQHTQDSIAAKPQAAEGIGFAEWQPIETKQAGVTRAAAHESRPTNRSDLPPYEWPENTRTYLAVAGLLTVFLAFVRLVK